VVKRLTLRVSEPRAAALLAGGALAAWAVALARMRGMDAGPGTDLGSIGWYVGVWVTMMVAMMLPSAWPMVTLFSRAARGAAGSGRAQTACFLAGYLATWTLFGLAAFGLYRGVRELDPAFLGWDRSGPYVAGGAVALAGVYQATPLKRVCLRHCRSPLHFLMRGWRRGSLGGLRMGATHGAYCVGCCWGLMLVLFAVGVMSVTWMVVVSAVVFAEKVLSVGERVARAMAVVLVAFGAWVALGPGTVPGLTQPGAGMPMTTEHVPMR